MRYIMPNALFKPKNLSRGFSLQWVVFMGNRPVPTLNSAPITGSITRSCVTRALGSPPHGAKTSLIRAHVGAQICISGSSSGMRAKCDAARPPGRDRRFVTEPRTAHAPPIRWRTRMRSTFQAIASSWVRTTSIHARATCQPHPARLRLDIHLRKPCKGCFYWLFNPRHC